MSRYIRLVLVMFLAFWSMGFQTSYFGPDIASYFEEYKTPMPHRNTVTWCMRDGCMTHQKYTYTPGDLASLRKLFRGVKDPAQEREAIGRSVVWMEMKLGRIPTDCTADTANTTSHMLVLERNKLIRFNSVVRPAGKWSWTRWPHWSARVRDKTSRQYWAVDPFFTSQGEFPHIVKFDDWYIARR